MTHTRVARRPLLALCMATPLLTLSGCGDKTEDPATSATPSPSRTLPPISDEDASKVVDGLLRESKPHIREHFGAFGESLLSARVVSSTYLDELTKRAKEFVAEGRAMPLTLDLKLSPAFDVGGSYANEMLLVARVGDDSLPAVLEAASAVTRGADAGIAFFAYHRSLDIAASSNGAPVLAHQSFVVLLPGSNLPISHDEKFTPPTSLVLIDRARTQVHELRAATGHGVTINPRPERSRALLTELVGKPRIDDLGSLGFAQILDERPIDVPGRDDPGTTYTVATMSDSFTAQPTGSAPTATVIGTAFAGSSSDAPVASSKMSLLGDPTQPPSPAMPEQYGPADKFPSARWAEAANAQTSSACRAKVGKIFLEELALVGAALAGCLVAGALASIACLIAWGGCFAAASAICAGIAGAALSALLRDFASSQIVCTLRVAGPPILN